MQEAYFTLICSRMKIKGGELFVVFVLISVPLIWKAFSATLSAPDRSSCVGGDEHSGTFAL